jgi:hypothetical protein
MDEIKQLVETLKKHTKFKQLATYSLQSLCKACSPPSNGWQESVRSAFALDSASVVAAVLSKNSTDNEIFGLCLSHLQSGAATGLGTILYKSGVAASVITSFTEFVTAAALPPCRDAVQRGLVSPAGNYSTGTSSPAALASGVMESMCRLVLYLVTQSRVDSAASPELRDCIVFLLNQAPTPVVKKMAAQALSAVARVPSAIEALTASGRLDALMSALTEVYALSVERDGGASAAASARSTAAAARSTPKAASSASLGAAKGGSSSWNGHIQPGFEFLDTLSRSERGVELLRGCAGTMSVFARAVDFAKVRGSEAGVFISNAVRPRRPFLYAPVQLWSGHAARVHRITRRKGARPRPRKRSRSTRGAH